MRLKCSAAQATLNPVSYPPAALKVPTACVKTKPLGRSAAAAR